ncbi:lariocidin/triculamin family lasso peptide core domain [Nocardia sp. IFM 10818]
MSKKCNPGDGCYGKGVKGEDDGGEFTPGLSHPDTIWALLEDLDRTLADAQRVLVQAR